MRKLVFFLAALAAFAGAAPAQAKLKVFACEPEWAALSTEIGGDLVDVYSATTGEQDPHKVQARPSLIVKARNADISVCTGAELEIGWLPLIQRQTSNAKIAPGADGYFEATSFVQLLDKPAILDRSQGDIHAYGNPHIQTDPRYVLFVAKPLMERFQKLDPANAATYAARYQDFAARFQQAINKWQQEAAPLNGVPIAVEHKSWVYMLTWLGMKEVIALEPKPGVPPSSGYLAQVVETLKTHPVKMVIRAAYEDPRGSDFVHQRLGVPEVMLPFTVGGTEEAKDLFSLYDDTINRLLGALKQ